MTEASRLVRAITSTRGSTNEERREEALRTIKTFARKSEENVDDLYDAILEGPFRSKQPEIRRRALVLCDYLFRRSVRFRTLCVQNFRQDIASAVFGKNLDVKTIPGSRAKVRTLRIAAIRCVHEWYEKFGKKSSKLNLAYRWIRTRISKLDFEQALSDNPDRLPRDPKQIRAERYAKWQNYEKVKQSMIEAERSVETSLSGVTRCLGMLLSTLPVSLDEKKDEEDEDEWEEVNVTKEEVPKTATAKMSNAEWAREHGIHDATSYRLAFTVNVGKVHVDDSNESILEELRDHEKTLQKHYLPKLVEWIRMLSSMNDPEETRKSEIQSRLHVLVDLRSRVDKALEKCSRIVVTTN